MVIASCYRNLLEPSSFNPSLRSKRFRRFEAFFAFWPRENWKCEKGKGKKETLVRQPQRFWKTRSPTTGVSDWRGMVVLIDKWSSINQIRYVPLSVTARTQLFTFLVRNSSQFFPSLAFPPHPHFFHLFAFAPIFARPKNEKCLKWAEKPTETLARQASSIQEIGYKAWSLLSRASKCLHQTTLLKDTYEHQALHRHQRLSEWSSSLRQHACQVETTTSLISEKSNSR